MCNNLTSEEGKTSEYVKNYSRNMKPEEMDEIETQGGRIFNDNEQSNFGDFRFDLKPVLKKNANKTEIDHCENDSSVRSPFTRSRKEEEKVGSDVKRTFSPSYKEEVKHQTTYQVPFQTIQSSNSQPSLFNPFGVPQNAVHMKNNDGRDSNLYRSLEQRLARNIQTMEQLIFHTRRVKLLLVQHHTRFQDYLDHLAQSQRHHLVNEEIIETFQNAVTGIQRYINILQQLEKHLEQPTRIAVEDYIKGMRETLKAQQSNADAADQMLNRLSSKVDKLKLIKISPNTLSTLHQRSLASN